MERVGGFGDVEIRERSAYRIRLGFRDLGDCRFGSGQFLGGFRRQKSLGFRVEGLGQFLEGVRKRRQKKLGFRVQGSSWGESKEDTRDSGEDTRVLPEGSQEKKTQGFCR